MIGTPFQSHVIGGSVESVPLDSSSSLLPPDSGFFSHVVSDRKVDANEKLPSSSVELPSAKKASSNTTK